MRAVLLALVLLLGIALGATAAPPKQARFTLDGVTYEYITGVNRTGVATLNGEAAPIESCAFVMLNPLSGNGRVLLHGLQDNATAVEMYVDQFRLPSGKRGYTYDKPVEVDGLERVADVAIRGNGSWRVGGERYYDPVTQVGQDTDKEQPQLAGRVDVLSVGVRDQATGLVADDEGADDELHVRFTSHPDAVPTDLVYTFTSPDPVALPPGVVPIAIPPGTVPVAPSEAFGVTYVLPNLKYGGNATLSIRADAYAPAGMNRLAITVEDPAGLAVANLTVEPSLGQPGEATVGFPLDRFGDYTLQVLGEVSLATYEVEVVLAAPRAVDLHLWYENVTYGHQAYLDYRACLKALESPDDVLAVERVVGQPAPPQMRVGMVVFSVAAAVGIATAAVKLLSDQLSLAVFRRNR